MKDDGLNSDDIGEIIDKFLGISRSKESVNQSTQQPVVAKKDDSYQRLRSQAESFAKGHRKKRLSVSDQIDHFAEQQKARIADVAKKPSERLLYSLILRADAGGSPARRLGIHLSVARQLKKGGYGKPKNYSPHSVTTQRALLPEDRRLIALMESLKSTYHDEYQDIKFFCLQDCDELLKALLETGRVFWESPTTAEFIPLAHGENRQLSLEWKVHSDGSQKLTYSVSGVQDALLLPLSPLWYHDSQQGCCGSVLTELPVEELLFMLQLPAVAPEEISAIQQKLPEMFPSMTQLPAPIVIEQQAVALTSIQPQVSLSLFSEVVKKRHSYYGRIYIDHDEVLVAFVKLNFDYLGRVVSLDEPDQKLSSCRDGKIREFLRDSDAERHCVDTLLDHGLKPLGFDPEYFSRGELQFCFVFSSDQAASEDVLLEKLSALNQLAYQQNWRLDIDDSFPVQLADEVDEWYSDLDDESSGVDWFSLTLGVVVNGEKVNLLPLLVDLINRRFREFDREALAALPDDTSCPLKLENGRYISVPFTRIRNILSVLCELFDGKPLDDGGALRLSQFQVGLLAEVEKAVGATQLRWFGGERLRRLGERLTNFTGINVVKPAEDFNATLRPYQQVGLNWMQFLREYEMGGILADDMGLGKTVQALAHLAVEQSAKRLDKPCLLVAPTSLVTNWVLEAERFAPKLSTLVLHGKSRSQSFSEIDGADLVITTYPLILRDKEELLAHEYYYLILDEAQQIKNTKAKVTQILLQVKATHRLCLTGTPMENHLGELWSLFHFVLPGLLGDAAQFKQRFRTPIERHGDDDRHQQLIKRIKPFMLRRSKNEVVAELPPKTEIVRTIEINGAQRDLYESVRLSMEERVREAVSKQGINRSHIVILDALLKLRQICCAPQLLKLASVKKDIESAKMQDLMTFLPNLIEEGRRVLLFSSFTSMLSLIEVAVKQAGIPYVKLTGQTVDRKTAIEKFQSEQVPLFLISLKAGGVGLNLTAADTVIHYDPWWNPAAEQQATDRAHRIGQTKPVFVYKLISKGTVEEKILAMQAKKQRLISGIVDQKAVKTMQLSDADLQVLFQPIT